MVVDEAQDFSPSWWDALEYLCDRKGSVWAFLDKRRVCAATRSTRRSMARSASRST